MFDNQTRILVLDDMAMIRKMVEAALREMGFTDIHEAANGQEGWEILANSLFPFGLVISDLNMPLCNGVELLKKVRADERTSKIPFILLTGESDVSLVTEALKFGVSNYLVKPFSPEILKKKLEQTHKKICA